MRYPALAAVAISIAATFSSCGRGQIFGNEVNTVHVSIPRGASGQGGSAFGVNPLLVNRGTQITWTNNDTIPHSVVSNQGFFNSGTLQTGQSYSYYFYNSGYFSYACTLHGSTETGAVQVN